MILDVLFHVALEAMGGAITFYALSFCTHRRHQAIVWLVLAFILSVVTVWVVG